MEKEEWAPAAPQIPPTASPEITPELKQLFMFTSVVLPPIPPA
jgi:hypothetical protein